MSSVNSSAVSISKKFYINFNLTGFIFILCPKYKPTNNLEICSFVLEFKFFFNNCLGVIATSLARIIITYRSVTGRFRAPQMYRRAATHNSSVLQHFDWPSLHLKSKGQKRKFKMCAWNHVYQNFTVLKFQWISRLRNVNLELKDKGKSHLESNP